MFEENEYLKHMADSLLSENITSLCKIEDRLRQEIDYQHKIMDNYILRFKSLLGNHSHKARAENTNALISFQRQKSTTEMLPFPNTQKLENFPSLTKVTSQNMYMRRN